MTGAATTPEEGLVAVPAEPPTPGATRPEVAGAVRYGDLLMTSGQTAVQPDGALVAVGRLGESVDVPDGRRCAWQCAANVVAAARAELGSLDQVEQVVRVTVYVASAPGFVEQHLVADAATQYFHSVFGADIGRHTRAALGVAELPTGSPVEIEAVMRIRPATGS
ncbi:RidA family protein [Nakamurella lactea]|uniref:RidA family protein n=1 Tax=Nakamurella lactea TaxID=459515 RepID=UPI000A051353|nr:RidA family protein [Nakamurella lactea]